MQKFNIFVEDLAAGEHVFKTAAGDTFMLALCAAANAPVATNSLLANLTTVSLTNLVDATPDVTISSASQTTGTFTLKITDYVLTATGAVGPFRYAVLYNSTSTSKTNPLIGWFDYGSDITLANTDTFTLNFDETNGVFTIV